MNRSEAGLAIQVPREGFNADLALASVRRLAEELRCRILGDGAPKSPPTWAFPREGSIFIFLISNSSQYRDTDPSTLPVNAMTNEELNAA